MKLQKEQLKTLCKGIGVDYEEPENRGEAVDKLTKEYEESDENFEGEKSIGWSMKGEK